MRSKLAWFFQLAKQLYDSGSQQARSLLPEPPQKTDSEPVLERKWFELVTNNLSGTNLSLLKSWASGLNFSVSSATYDEDLLLEGAEIVWPDGSSGEFTRLVKNSVFLTTDSYSVTHADSGLVFTQPEVTRNASGLVTEAPELSISTQ